MEYSIGIKSIKKINNVLILTYKIDTEHDFDQKDTKILVIESFYFKKSVCGMLHIRLQENSIMSDIEKRRSYFFLLDHF